MQCIFSAVRHGIFVAARTDIDLNSVRSGIFRKNGPRTQWIGDQNIPLLTELRKVVLGGYFYKDSAPNGALRRMRSPAFNRTFPCRGRRGKFDKARIWRKVSGVGVGWAGGSPRNVES
jgi:hypothetical protein